MIGTKIGRYVITAKIGEGGMGSVWRAEDPNLGREVALKFLPESMAGSAEARKRFVREGKAAATLKHPGIAAVHDADESNGRIYIAFELVEGETVSERIARGPLDITGACRVAFDAAEALDHAHESGVLHRDVTSRNIMIDKKGQVIVVDFGLALPQGATRVTHTGTAVGTAPYLSPEVITGGEGDARSDVYGLGVVLYEMLTGHLPFEAERSESLFYLIVHTDAEPPSAKRDDIPPELDRIVMKALAKDPAQRYGSAREFAKDLCSYLETASVEPPSARWLTAPVPKPSRPPGRRVSSMAKRPVARAIASIVVVAIAAWVWWSRPPGGESQAFASVAVLPFQNLSEVPAEDAWLAEGIAEALAGRLTSVPGVRVTPWFTSRNFGDTSRALKETAKTLNVEALVIGTVRQIGERVLCHVTVVDSKTESQWWADEFEEPVDDLFDVQRRIALGVAKSLKGQLSGTEKQELARPAAHSVEAYEYYVRGSILMQEGTPEDLNRALPFFERAIELDPELADAYVGVGAVCDNQFWLGLGGVERLRKAEEMFQRALELDPASTRARRGLGRLHWHHGRSEDVLREGQAALQRNPEVVENLVTMGEAYTLAGLPEKAIPILERVIALDPASEAAYFFVMLAHQWAGESEAAIEGGEAYFRRFGDNPPVVYFVVGLAYHTLGDFDTAEIYYERSIPRTLSDAWISVPALYLDKGDENGARIRATELIALLGEKLAIHPDHFWLRGMVAALYGMKGDISKMRQMIDGEPFVGPNDEIFIAAALARSGDVASAAQLLEACFTVKKKLLPLMGYTAVFPDGFFERPEVQPALRAMKALHDDLAARY